MGRPKVFLEATPLINTHLSGIGHVVLETLRALDTDEFKHYDLRAFVPADEYDRLKAYDFIYIKPVKLPYIHKFFSLFARLRFAPPLDLFLGRGTYVFFNFRNWNLAASASLTYIHDVCFMRFPEFVEPKNLRFLKTYTPMWLRRTSRIIAVSDTSREEIKEFLGVDNAKIVTIRNTVDTGHYSAHSQSDVDAVRQKYSLNNDYILFVGNIEPRKNLKTLVDAFAASERARSATLFIVGGDGWLNESVNTAIEDATSKGYDVRRNATFVPDEDIALLMTGARAVAVPSWHEGFGLPALEALASGTPVIASDIPGLREAVKGYESYVSFFNPNDTDSLSGLITEALTTAKPKGIKVTPDTWTARARQLIEQVEKVRSTYE